MMPFERLDAWKLAHELTLRVYQTTRGFPAEERYDLTKQLRRSASSVPANIAEGSGAPSKAEFKRYLAIASRSLNETGYWFRLARDLAYMTPEEWEILDALRNRAGAVMWGLRKSL